MGALPVFQCRPFLRARALRSSGFALVAVLWIVAVMSLIAMGLVYSVRNELRVTAFARQAVQAQALGDAAMMLGAQQLPMLRMEEQSAMLFKLPVQYAGVDMELEMRSVTGLVNVSLAPPELLATLFERIGRVDAATAGKLAELVILYRDEIPDGLQKRNLEAVEDLLQIPGIGYDLYARVENFAVATPIGSLLVDPRAAPEEILQMLGINRESPGLANMAGISNSQLFRFTVSVPLDGVIYRVRRDINVQASLNRDGLAWVMSNPVVSVQLGP